ncbi:MAG: DUF1559 domain-containing protein [Thermoguttaceae bacterium]
MTKRNSLTCIELFVVFAVILMLMGLLLPALQGSREAARCVWCKSKMEQIGVALKNYHDRYGSFPPVYTVDADGKPLHSWRTLILPFFDKEARDFEPKWKAVYDKIRFDEPWDSEYNTQFHKKLNIPITHDPEGGNPFYNNMPSVYGCPDTPNETTKTVYQMVIGAKTIGNSEGTALSQLKKRPDEVVLLVEVWPPVPWMSPNDFQESDFPTAISRDNIDLVYETYQAEHDKAFTKRKIFGGEHGRELHLLFANGTVKTYYDWKLPVSEIEKMCQVE